MTADDQEALFRADGATERPVSPRSPSTPPSRVALGVEVTLTQSEITHAVITGTVQQHFNVYANRPDHYACGAREGLLRHIDGAGAEVAAGNLLNLRWLLALDRPQRRPDLGGLVHVRQTEYADGHLRVYPEDPDDFPFVLVTGVVPVYRVVGWCLGAFAKLFPIPKGYREHWVPQSALLAIDALVWCLNERAKRGDL